MTADTRMQSANVLAIGSAHSHNTQEAPPEPCTLPAHSSLKALADAVLGRTLSRTLPAQSAPIPSTFGAQCADASHNVEQAELAWLLHLCGDAYGFTPDERAAAMHSACADLAAALKCFRVMAGELADNRPARYLDENRVTCNQCANLIARRCQAAKRGEILASRGYEPIRDLPRRCEGYLPGADDPDRRPGRERWPGLIEKGGK